MSFAPAPPLWAYGPTPGAFYTTPTVGMPSSSRTAFGQFPSFPSQSQIEDSQSTDTRQRTLNPIVTGTSVLGIKFEGGVAIAADTLGSYGSLARFRNVSRLVKVGDATVVGGSGDIADFNMIRDYLNTLEIENREAQDGHEITPQAVHSYLTRVMYNRRSKFDPLWNTVLVGGMKKGVPYLAYTDKLGVAYEEQAISCGYGSYIALPLMREVIEKGEKLTKDDAVNLLQKCLQVLWYRDARSLNRYEIATITSDGVKVSQPQAAPSDWSIASMVRAVMFSFTTCTLVEWPKGLPCGITVARPFRSITGRCKLLLDLSDISIIVYLNRGQDREGRKNRED
eukprot:gene6495-9368_t